MVSGYQMMLIYLRFHSPLCFLEQAENALSHFSFSLLLLLYSLCSVITCLFFGFLFLYSTHLIFVLFQPSFPPSISCPFHLFQLPFPSLSLICPIFFTILLHYSLISCYFPCFHLSIFHLFIPLSPTPPTKVSILPLSLSICCLPPLTKTL